jgi:hypothetical protein
MSKNEEKQAFDSPSSTASKSKKLGRMAKAKKVTIILVSCAALAVGVIVLMSLPRGAEGFIVQMDHDLIEQQKKAHYSLTISPTGEATSASYLRGDPLGNAWPTTALTVREYYDSIKDVLDGKVEGAKPGGSHKFVDNGESKALLYTFYLRNDSKDEEAHYRLRCVVTNRTDPTNDAKNPYDYLRIVMRQGNVGEPDDSVVYYGNQNIQEMGTTQGDPSTDDRNDLREAISDWEKYTRTKEVEDEKGNTREEQYYLRNPTYIEKYSVGDKEYSLDYCVNFDNAEDRNLLFDANNLIIPAGKTRRITFIAYFEGKDPDAYGSAPKGAQLGMSLIVGI